MTELFDGRLTQYGIEEAPMSAHRRRMRALTDGKAVLYVEARRSGAVQFTCHIDSDARPILDAISRTCKTEIYSDDQYQYWGSESEEEFAAANTLEHGIPVDARAIVEKLLAEDPSLGDPERVDDLYDRLDDEIIKLLSSRE